MSATSARREARRGVPIALAVVLMVVFAGAGAAAGWTLRPDPVPEAETVARDLGALLEGPHPILDQDDDGREVAALYAEDARALDGPSGITEQGVDPPPDSMGQGRDQIAQGWQFMFAQGGTWTVDHVLGDDRWAALVTTWNHTDAEGTTRVTPMVLLIEVRDGLIVSELDIYDAAAYEAANASS